MTSLRAFHRSGHAPTLWASFLYFAFSCGIWVINGAMAPFISETYQLTPAKKGLMLSIPIFAGAQSHKIGIVDSQKVLSEMPEMKSMQSELDNLAKKYEDTLVQLQKEFQTKYQDFVKEQETMVESIKSRKQQELEDLSKRIQDLNNVAQQDMQKKQVELFAPIQTKLREAINKVGNDGGFTYIMDASQMLYVGNGSEDVTSLVKSKLGL